MAISTLREYITSSSNEEFLFVSIPQITALGEHFYKLVKKPASVCDNFFQVIPVSHVDEGAKRKEIGLLLSSHLDDITYMPANS